MNKYYILLMILISNICIAQKFTVRDNKYWFYEFRHDNTIKAYFNEIGVPACKTCAHYFRISKIDEHYFMFVGNTKDYYMDSTLYFEGFIDSIGFYSGTAKYFYPNGKLMEKGIYKNGVRDSIWTYYYNNGNIKRVVDFSQNQSKLVDFYSRRGKQMVTNGTGKYKDNLKLGFLTTYETIVEGEMKSGNFDGEWTLKNSFYGKLDGIEYYNKGTFIKGVSISLFGDSTYSKKPLLTFYEYVPQEKMNLYRFSLICPGFRVSPPSYKDDYTLSSSFYPELIKNIENQVDVKNLENQWFIVTFNINETKQLNNFQIKSSLKNEILSQTITQIVKSMTDWTREGVLNDKTFNYPFYIVIALENGKLILPAYHIYTFIL